MPNVPNSVEIWQTFRNAVQRSGDLRQEADRAVVRRRRREDQDLDQRRLRRWPSRPRRRGGRMRKVVRACTRSAPLFVAPYAIFLVALFGYPLVLRGLHLILRLLLRGAGRRRRPALRRSAELHRHPERPAFQRSVLNVFEFILINVPLTVLLSLVLASALNAKLPFRRSSGRATTSPTSRPAWRSSAVWLWLFSGRRAGERVARRRWRPTRPGWSTSSGRCR